MKKEKVILIGGGGHCKSCIDVIEEDGFYEIAGIVDMPGRVGEEVFGYKIIGTDADLQDLVIKYSNVLICLGSIGKRKALYERLTGLNASFPVIVSPKAQVSDRVALGQGTVVFHQAVVNANAKIGTNCIINTSAVVEHDCVIGDHCHIATGAVINGGCRIQERTFIGSNATVLENIQVASDVVAGAGCVVTKNITESGTYLGVPARKVGALV